MSTYLKFFELEQSPFEGKAQAQVVLGTRALRDAFGTIQTGLAEGASRICVNGGRGFGKTSLARALPKLLGDSARIALLPDPSLSWEASRRTLSRQWGLEAGGLPRAGLIEAAREHRLVLVIDQAEKANEEFLDHLDVLLSYRSEDDEPVVQSVLMAHLKTARGEAPCPLIWWLDRIQTLQLEFAPLPRDGIESYIQKHLKRAGWRGARLFSEDAAYAIHGYTGGVPGEVSQLCEKLLAEAAARDIAEIDADFVHSICDSEADSESEVWALEDEFEKLALEDEFSDPDVLAHALADAEEGAFESEAEFNEPLSEPLEGALGDETGLDRGADAALAEEPMEAAEEEEEEDPLDAPPTLDELRAIRGSRLTPWLRPVALSAIAAVIGGVLFAMFTGDAPPPRSDLSDSLSRTTAQADRQAREGSRSDSSNNGKPRLLLQPGGRYVSVDRLRKAEKGNSGPVTPRERDRAIESETTQPAAIAAFGDHVEDGNPDDGQPGSTRR